MQNILISIRNKLLLILGSLKYSKYPMFLQIEPQGYKIKGNQIREILDIIKPGDIILRKYDNFLDNIFLGKYSHVGLIIDNKTIIHSIYPKVEEIDIIDFLKTDHILILRPINLTEPQIEIAIKIAKENLNNPYDFGFSLKTKNELYCSELIYICYEDFKEQLNMSKKIIKLFYIFKKEVIKPEDFENFSGLKKLIQFN
jgi:uncharacterized protein YycO